MNQAGLPLDPPLTGQFGPLLPYLLVGGGGLYEVRLLRRDGAAWQVELVIPGARLTAGPGAGLRFTSAGVPYLTFLMLPAHPDPWFGRFVAHREGASWVNEFVGLWGFTSLLGGCELALDADERPTIAAASGSGSLGLLFAHQ